MPAFTAINPGRFGPNLCADLMSCSCVLCGKGRLNNASTAFACEAYVLLLVLFVVNFVVVVVVVLAKMAIGVDDDFDENDSDASFKATEEEKKADDFDVEAKTEPHTLLILVAFNSAAAASAEAAAAEGFVAAAARLNMMPSIGGFFAAPSLKIKSILIFAFVVSKFSFFVVFLLFCRTFHISQHKSYAQSKIILSSILIFRESFKRTTLTGEERAFRDILLKC